MIRGRDSGGHAHWAHAVQFYEDEAVLAARVGTFLGDGLAAGDLTIVITTESHREALQRQLEKQRCDVAYACASGQLAFLDARETLSRFMRRGEPDGALFESVVGGLLAERAVAAPGAQVRAFGEMVDVLWQREERYAALRLEELWNDLSARHSFSLLCSYAMSGFRDDLQALNCVAGAHTLVLDAVRAGAHGQASLATPPPLPPALPSEYARWLAQEVKRRETLERALRKSLCELDHKRSALRQLEAAHTSEFELRSILDALPVLVSYVDADRKYCFVNAAFERWFGRAAPELLGKHLEFVLGCAVYAEVRPHVDATFAGEDASYTIELPHRDGGTRAVETTHVPRFGADGTVVGYVALSFCAGLPPSG
jgi:PAS domain S-box-containing protein